MTVNRFISTFLLLCLGAATLGAGQVPDADRKLFEQIKAKADKGEAEAQLALGSLYASGIGVAKDERKAAKWHRRAADQGLARAQYQVALDYAHGDGVKPDKVAAVKWFSRAADQGVMEAQLDLGLCYLNGEGVHENGAVAVEWFRKAAGQRMAYGQYEVGKCYFEGIGVAKDLDEGVKWVRQAAEQGFAPAQNYFGQCCERGTGVTQDTVQAYKWYALAAAQDDDQAPDIRLSLAKLESVLTKEQVAEAQRLAREFRPSQQLVVGKASQSTSPNSSVSSAGQTGSASFAPVPANTANAGFVNVRADDETCEVFADGGFVGNSPARLKLSEGRHLVEVKRTGFKEYRREINITAGSELNLHATLEKQ